MCDLMFINIRSFVTVNNKFQFGLSEAVVSSVCICAYTFALGDVRLGPEISFMGLPGGVVHLNRRFAQQANSANALSRITLVAVNADE